MPGLSAPKRQAIPSLDAGFLRTARTVFVEIVARLARARKWRRDRAALARMDYAALRDIGFASAPWSANPGPGDQFARNIGWSGAKRLRALLRDCTHSRGAAQAAIRQNRLDGSGDSGRTGDRAAE